MARGAIMARSAARCWDGRSGDDWYIIVDNADLDVYTETGWKEYELEKSNQKTKKEVVSLSSDDEEIPPPPSDISLNLCGPNGKIRIRVREVIVFFALLIQTVSVGKMASVYRNEHKIPAGKKI